MLKRILKSTLILSFLVSTFSLGACDPAINSDYNGEILASFKGSVSNSLENAPENINVLLMWGRANDHEELYEWNVTGDNDIDGLDNLIKDSVKQQSTEVSGDFPSVFQVDVFSNPSEDVFLTWALSSTKSVEIAIGFFTAVKDFDQGLKFNNIVGVVENKIVYYIKSQDDADLINSVKNSNFVAGYNMRPFGLSDAPVSDEVSLRDNCVEAYTKIGPCVEAHISGDDDINLANSKNYVTHASYADCKAGFFREVENARDFDDKTFGIYDEACDGFNELILERPENINMSIELREQALMDSDLGYLLRALYEDKFAKLHHYYDGDVYPEDL